MSRQAQLPPRCPVQKKNTNCQDTVALSSSLLKGNQKSISQGSEQPELWNALLSDSDSFSIATLQKRIASDSLTFLDGLAPLSGLDQHNDTENLDSCESDYGLEPRCAYGPNSPRTKNRSGFSGKEIVSAFSECIVQKHLDGPNLVSGFRQSDSSDNICFQDNAITSENAMKRHPGRRSRLRKLQYIAELEKTVHGFQNLVSELFVRVDSLHMQNVALSMENNTLKQQLLVMQQEKFILEGEHRSLLKEFDIVKSGIAFSPKKFNNWSVPAANFAHSDAIWEMPDIGNLGLK